MYLREPASLWVLKEIPIVKTNFKCPSCASRGRENILYEAYRRKGRIGVYCQYFYCDFAIEVEEKNE